MKPEKAMNPYSASRSIIFRLIPALFIGYCGLSSAMTDSTNKFSYSFNEIERNLVAIEGKRGETEFSGCGFIANIDGKRRKALPADQPAHYSRR
jgi:hypothetical protein